MSTHLPDVVHPPVRPQIANGGSQGGLVGAAARGGAAVGCHTQRVGYCISATGSLGRASGAHRPSRTIASGLRASLLGIRHWDLPHS